MNFELTKLPYGLTSLAPVLSQDTLEYHHGKHLQAYVNNLNNLKTGTKFENMDLLSIIKESDGPIFNNAAQVFNHEFYFEQFSTNPKAKPDGALAKAIDATFGSFDNFQKEFSAAAIADATRRKSPSIVSIGFPSSPRVKYLLFNTFCALTEKRLEMVVVGFIG